MSREQFPAHQELALACPHCGGFSLSMGGLSADFAAGLAVQFRCSGGCQKVADLVIDGREGGITVFWR